MRTYEVAANATKFDSLKTSKRWTIKAGSDSARLIRINNIRPDSFSLSLGLPQRRPDHFEKPNKLYWRKLRSGAVKMIHININDTIPLTAEMTLSYADVKSVYSHRVSMLSLLTTPVMGFLYYTVYFYLVWGCINC
jgi:hypothetical protein